MFTLAARPLRPLFPSLFDDVFGTGLSAWLAFRRADDESHFGLELDLPGVAASDISVIAHNGRLSIRAHNGQRDYSYSFDLPRAVDAAAAEAQFVNGVLALKMPWSAAHAPLTIPVSAPALEIGSTAKEIGAGEQPVAD